MALSTSADKVARSLVAYIRCTRLAAIVWWYKRVSLGCSLPATARGQIFAVLSSSAECSFVQKMSGMPLHSDGQVMLIMFHTYLALNVCSNLPIVVSVVAPTAAARCGHNIQRVETLVARHGTKLYLQVVNIIYLPVNGWPGSW